MHCKEIDFTAVVAIAREAGAAIMAIYAGDFEVQTKADDSPLTCADRAAHRLIVAGLTGATPAIPILSEEGQAIPFAERREWQRFWLVDPLDGTKEFIKRNGEFTVNIALVEAGRVVAGVVHVPTRQATYVGLIGQGAWRQVGQQPPVPIRVRRADPKHGLSVVMSRSHPSPDLEAYLKTIKVAETVEVGSSLKLCVVAAGEADLYPRLGPTMEWDTAAGQAVVEAAGGTVTTLDGLPLAYNKEQLLNPYFIVRGE
ncbi:MAG: 3'(2'),5'-bisphosphate nucleotidase CysQ [Desulfuromonadales bacterium]|nr:3'(2'),5'-bisphosphate nucleotidase CysQ [Desulfuromonadales bacterium]